MIFHPKQFGIVLKNARIDKKLTQAELAEILDISLSYLKDLERFRNNPSYEIFERVIRYFNLSADSVIYPNRNSDKTLFIAFINCYILSPKSPQTLENAKFIASEFALRLSLMLYPFPSCYEPS
ncbi:MAG: helix-turn-helix transcriptional regulator [Lachnospiraceae bacterium]|nr:helix-turn-helix transcriptional regulator [Lachnospiraceae bacterium]